MLSFQDVTDAEKVRDKARAEAAELETELLPPLRAEKTDLDAALPGLRAEKVSLDDRLPKLRSAAADLAARVEEIETRERCQAAGLEVTLAGTAVPEPRPGTFKPGPNATKSWAKRRRKQLRKWLEHDWWHQPEGTSFWHDVIRRARAVLDLTDSRPPHPRQVLQSLLNTYGVSMPK